MRALGFALVLSVCPIASSQLTPTANDVYVRVIDVGAGLCCVIQMLNNHYMIYDAGVDSIAMNEIQEVIPAGSSIDLLVLSHSDADHIGAVDEICDAYTVRKELHHEAVGHQER